MTSNTSPASPGDKHPPDDQVIRLRRFQAGFPEVEIERPDYSHHRIWWHAHLDGQRIASDIELRGLLDQLGRMFGEDAQ
jgi:hypothetical protein